MDGLKPILRLHSVRTQHPALRPVPHLHLALPLRPPFHRRLRVLEDAPEIHALPLVGRHRRPLSVTLFSDRESSSARRVPSPPGPDSSEAAARFWAAPSTDRSESARPCA